MPARLPPVVLVIVSIVCAIVFVGMCIRHLRIVRIQELLEQRRILGEEYHDLLLQNDGLVPSVNRRIRELREQLMLIEAELRDMGVW